MTRSSLTTFLETIEAWTRLATDDEVDSLARLVAEEQRQRGLPRPAVRPAPWMPRPPERARNGPPSASGRHPGGRRPEGASDGAHDELEGPAGYHLALARDDAADTLAALVAARAPAAAPHGGEGGGLGVGAGWASGPKAPSPCG